MDKPVYQFIYAMNKKDKKHLEKLGFRLLKADTSNNLWIFENKPDIKMAEDLLRRCVCSNIVSL